MREDYVMEDILPPAAEVLKDRHYEMTAPRFTFSAHLYDHLDVPARSIGHCRFHGRRICEIREYTFGSSVIEKRFNTGEAREPSAIVAVHAAT